MKILLRRWTEHGTTMNRLQLKWWGGVMTWQLRRMLLRRLKVDGLYELKNGELKRIDDVN